MATLLEARDLTKQFGGLTAVSNLRFCVQEGEALGLIGPNGAGKTTVFNLIMGEFRQNSGELFFKSEEITKYATHERVKRGIARTYQVPRPFGEMTVAENIRVAMMPDDLWQMLTKGAERAAEKELLKSVGFGDVEAARFPGELSLGDLRRLELARTLASDPELLLLDEVFAGLTVGEITQISELLVEKRRQGLTYIMVSHDLRSLAPLVDRVVVMSFGAIIAEGSFEEVVKDEKVREAYLGQ